MTTQEATESDPLRETRSLSQHLARQLSEKKAEDIKILEVFHLLPVCDFFLIATGRNAQHLTALCDHIREEFPPSVDLELRGVEGYDEGTWVVMDFGAVVIHLFQEHVREHYRIERLWADAPEISWSE